MGVCGEFMERMCVVNRGGSVEVIGVEGGCGREGEGGSLVIEVVMMG